MKPHCIHCNSCSIFESQLRYCKTGSLLVIVLSLSFMPLMPTVHNIQDHTPLLLLFPYLVVVLEIFGMPGCNCKTVF